jgi:hypothetical protein
MARTPRAVVEKKIRKITASDSKAHNFEASPVDGSR